MQTESLIFRNATLEDAETILTITNDAFVADAFFKKQQYHDRFDLPTVLEMIAAENSAFILAESTENDVNISAGTVVGSLYLHWEIKRNENKCEVVGKFSAVSVPSKFGKRGIGKALVDAAEAKIRNIGLQLKDSEANPNSETSLSLQMGVINQRQDLFSWYGKQGFVITGEIRGDPEIERITLDEMKDDIWLVLMSKSISL